MKVSSHNGSTFDHHTEARKAWIRSQSTHETKLQQAVDWLKERERHCFTEPLSKRIYEPVHGRPLSFVGAL